MNATALFKRRVSNAATQAFKEFMDHTRMENGERRTHRIPEHHLLTLLWYHEWPEGTSLLTAHSWPAGQNIGSNQKKSLTNQKFSFERKIAILESSVVMMSFPLTWPFNTLLTPLWCNSTRLSGYVKSDSTMQLNEPLDSCNAHVPTTPLSQGIGRMLWWECSHDVSCALLRTVAE